MSSSSQTQDNHDPVWNAAWEWVQQQNGAEAFDASPDSPFARWLRASPAHLPAYRKASRLLAAAGMIPPTHDIVEPDDEAPTSS